jgi:UDP-N-acetylmuramate dehydrogenase
MIPNSIQSLIDISEFSNFKTPALAKYFFEIDCEDSVKKIYEIYQFAKSEDLPVLVIGWGTNMLFAFDIFTWVVIKNSLKGWSYDTKTQVLDTYSSEPIRWIAEVLFREWESELWTRFIGLPWSVWGAVYGNAGCFGLETESNFLDCEVVDLETGKRRIFEKKDMRFSYRSSLLKETSRYFLVKARFDLSKKVEKYHSDVDTIDFRENQQPKGHSCWSFFKNPEWVRYLKKGTWKIEQDKDTIKKLEKKWVETKKLSAGYLIEEVDLKGTHYRGGYFSSQHANFLMSDGDTCSYRDFLYLIQLAQTRVREKFWIELENEVRIITN